MFKILNQGNVFDNQKQTIPMFFIIFFPKWQSRSLLTVASNRSSRLHWLLSLSSGLPDYSWTRWRATIALCFSDMAGQEVKQRDQQWLFPLRIALMKVAMFLKEIGYGITSQVLLTIQKRAAPTWWNRLHAKRMVGLIPITRIGDGNPMTATSQGKEAIFIWASIYFWCTS